MSEMYDIQSIWNDWKIVRFIGEGSFGKVYEIVRSRFGIEEHCALKVISIPASQAEVQSLRNDGMDDVSVTQYYSGLVSEFAQEISLMSKLKGNANVVSYEDYYVKEYTDRVGWDIVIRMELLRDFPSYMRDNPMTEKDIVSLGVDMCNALELCAKHNIIHRDIKPDNIFVSQNGNFKFGDFGVARTIEKTVSGLSKKGTYTYMAPEVYRGESYGMNVDIYSLGIVLYKLLNSNREPFLPAPPQPITYNDKNVALVCRMNGQAVPSIPGIKNETNRIVLKACEFDSKARYQTASELKADLENLLRNWDKEGSSKTTAPIQNVSAAPVQDLNATVSVVGSSVPAPAPAPAQTMPAPKPAPAPAQTMPAPKPAPVPPQAKPAPVPKAKTKKSNWWVFLIIGVLVVAILGVGAFFLSGLNERDPEEPDDTDETTAAQVMELTEETLIGTWKSNKGSKILSFYTNGTFSRTGETNADYVLDEDMVISSTSVYYYIYEDGVLVEYNSNSGNATGNTFTK
ncbi:MAG: protein kinase [Ruminococcus sp.]|nr:protein kinase [Ruminococcus sp.]